MDGPVKVFTVIVLVALPTVMFGGFSLLRLTVAKRLSGFRMTYFRAGHAHAGVLLVLALAALDVLSRVGLGAAATWTVCLLLAVGIIAQPGGMFLHMAIGEAGRWSPGNSVSVAGAVLLTVAMLWLAYGVAVA